MKIALVILHADPTLGGAEKYTHDLAESLAQAHNVSLLASTFSKRSPAGVRLMEISADGLTRSRRYKNFLNALDRHAAQENYDIVHAMLPVLACDLYHPHAGLAVRSIDEAKGLKRLGNALNPRRGLFAQVERTLLSSPDAPRLLCLSERMRHDVIVDGICSPDQATVLFNAVDLKKFDPLAFPHLPGDRLRALIVAQDFNRKGVGPAIEAIARTSQWHLTIVGKDDAAPYQRLAKSLGVADRISFTGALADVRPMYQQADVFLLPTSHDPCSLVVLEALAMGLPVISTRANGACEIMTHGVQGFVLEHPTDIDAIVSALTELTDPGRRAEFSEACMKLRPQLSFEMHVRQWIEMAQRQVVSRAQRIGSRPVPD